MYLRWDGKPVKTEANWTELYGMHLKSISLVPMKYKGAAVKFIPEGPESREHTFVAKTACRRITDRNCKDVQGIQNN